MKAAAILGLVIMLAYGEVSFLGYTLNPGLWNLGVLTGPQYGYRGRWLAYAYVIDPLATGGQNWPIYAFIARAIVSGKSPLWNPFQGIGAPLAADTSWDAYFPLNILYSIPNQYWDYVWLLKLWLAGIFCYLFLRTLKLSFMPSLGGSFAYCLSGSLIFYPFMPWSDIAIFTPLLLLVAKRCFDQPLNAKLISAGGTVFAASILGAHIEALIIQFLFVNLFALFEIITRKNNRIRGVTTWLITVLLGLGITGFFLLPVIEYLSLAYLGHSGNVGVTAFLTEGNPMTWILTLFVPYFFGFLQTYPYHNLRQVFFWDLSPGYVGTSVFFLSSITIFSLFSRRKVERTSYPAFFVGAALLILLKIFGIPPINWIGYLPVLDHVIFTRYSGSVLAMAFSGASAFGLENVLHQSTSSKRLVKEALLPLFVIVFAVSGSVPFPASPSNPFFIVSIGYLALALFFLFLSCAIASMGGADAVKALIFLVILELVIYIPKSLTASYEATRVAVCAGSGVLLATYLFRSKMRMIIPGFKTRMIIVTAIVKRIPYFQELRGTRFFALMLVTILLLQSVIASIGPMGLPNRYDAFTEAPYISFLKMSVGNQRAYSLDGVFFPSVACIFSIQQLGEFSAFMPHLFRKFAEVNLDRGMAEATLVGNAWTHTETPSVSSEISNNIAFYSLLGVEYFISKYTYPSINSEVLLQPEVEGSQSWAPLGDKSVSTRFVTDMPFNRISVRIGTYDRINLGEIVLVLDSVPFNATSHRESRIYAKTVLNGVPNMFSFAEVKVVRKTEFQITLSQSDTRRDNEVAAMWWPHVKNNTHLAISDGSLNLALGIAAYGELLPVVYSDENVTIYKNPNAFPRAFLANNVVFAKNQEEAVLKTRDLGWGTKDNLVLEEEPSTEELTLIHASEGVAISRTAEIVRYSTNEVVIWANTSVPSFLVLTDIYYPGWKCYIDGQPGKIYRAYGAVRAVFLTQGSHEIVFRYEPESFRFGVIISTISVAIAFFLFTRRRVVRILRGQLNHGSAHNR